LLPIRYHSHF